LNPGLTPRVRDEYRARVNRVLDFIDEHLEDRFTLGQLARVACFSKYHFDRVFRAVSGETLFEYIQRRRVEKAAYLVRANPRTTITGIALACGFADSAAATRAFRRRFGVTPSRWRQSQPPGPGPKNSNHGQDPGWTARHNSRLKAGIRRLAARFKGVRVIIGPQPETTVAYVRQTGPFQGDEALFRAMHERLFSWAEPRGLVRPGPSRIYILSHDSPTITEAPKLRVSLGLSVPPGTPIGAPVGKLTLPGGEYARARFVLGKDDYADAWGWMFACWLPGSGYQADDRPCFESYPVPERRRKGKTVVDICVPVRPL
jgi:AraC family transcriptional regulator